MLTYDLLMLSILVGLTLYGYFKGMAWQIAYIASFVASYFIAMRFADRVAPSITFVNPPLNKFVAILLIYMAASFGIWMIFRIVRGGIDKVKMDGFDHQMGALIGFARGVLWCVAFTFFALTLPLLPDAAKQHIVTSKSGYYIAQLVDKSNTLFPPEVHQVIGPYLNQLGNELAPTNDGAPPSWPATAGYQPPQQPVAQPAPSYNQPPPAPAWPSSSNVPTGNPTAADLGWPTAQPAQPQGASQTPSQQTSWPNWP